MNKLHLLLALATLITLATYFVTTRNPVCNYSNSMSQSEMLKTAGHQRGFPVVYVREPAWSCNEAGESAKFSTDFELLYLGAAFMVDVGLWFSVLFTASYLRKGVHRRV
jgi:hypothetical protein